ncbi:MAG: hypothetical protein I8H66_02060 [Sphingobacteriia bacterium]|nr:hypothetical protein [Sphingobacteriia bacterium]
MKNFKEEELIMYIYNDCPPELTAAINQAIKEDAALNDKIVTLKRTAEQLDRLKLKSPSPKIIQAILDYAAKSARKQD